MKTAERDLSWYVEQERKIQDSADQVARLRAELHRRFDPGHLYVIEFDSGVIKVGKARRAKSRIAAHSKTGLIRRSWASERHTHCSKTERLLIEFGNSHGQLYGGREYFTGLDFATVCTYAGMVVADALRRAYLDALIEAVDGDLDATWQQAHKALTGNDDVTGEVAA